jgi:S1-C subfamily serine protease
MAYAECQQWTQNGNQITCTNDPATDPLRNGQFANSLNNAANVIGAAIYRARVHQAMQQQQDQEQQQQYQESKQDNQSTCCTAAQLDRRNHPENYDATPPKRGHLGVQLIPIQEAVKLDLPTCTIYSVVSGGAAYKAGLHGGDVIRSVAGLSVDGSDSLLKALERFKPGDSVAIGFTRHGENKVSTLLLN